MNMIDSKIQTLLGPFIKCPHPEMIEASALAGFDFSVVDMEHTIVGPKDVYALQLAAEVHKHRLVVRIPKNDEVYFKWALDLGVEYVQVPFVQTASDAQYAKDHAHFSPIGKRGLCRFVRGAEFSAKSIDSYIQEANEKCRLLFQIEGLEGIANIDEILEVGGMSYLFVGPYDLSQSMKVPGDIWHEKVVTKMVEIVEKCQEKNIELATFTDTLDGIKFWKSKGVSMIQYGSDLNIFIDGAKRLLNEVGKR